MIDMGLMAKKIRAVVPVSEDYLKNADESEIRNLAAMAMNGKAAEPVTDLRFLGLHQGTLFIGREVLDLEANGLWAYEYEATGTPKPESA